MPTEQSDIEGELVTWRVGLYDAVTICFYHEELFFNNILLIKQDTAT